jgi:hypothetical protein
MASEAAAATTQQQEIVQALRRHPRVAFQNLAGGATEIDAIRASLPPLVAFGDASYHKLLPILDWDHKLPSKVAILRIYAYYSEATYRAGEAEFEARNEQIAERDKFPEFDVPDFAGITADEAYEAEVEPSGKIGQLRLVSSWRRDIEQDDAHISVQLARRSDEFRKLVSSIRRRPDYLGDLEAVCWTPPCESSYSGWTIDVWYLTDLSASVGKGRSFLVDLEAKKVVGVREFMVRSG